MTFRNNGLNKFAKNPIMPNKPGWLSGVPMFGRSNVGNVPTPTAPPAPAPTTEPARSQLDPKNNNQQPITANGTQEGSHLAEFADVFKLPEGYKPPDDPFAAPIISLDPAKLKEAVSKMNFAAGVDPAVAAKALAGDAASLSQLLSQAGQNAFTASINASSQMLEEALNKHTERYDTALPERVRQLQLQQTDSKNPVLQTPAAKTMVDGAKMAIAAANPHLTAEAVQQKAEDMFLAMHKDLSAHEETQVKATKNKSEPDFSSFLR